MYYYLFAACLIVGIIKGLAYSNYCYISKSDDNNFFFFDI